MRDEAERLVAAAIAAVSLAARGLSGAAGRTNFATGTPECCVCPVCRVIAAMREPSPELSERLATGAGDLAAGVTSLLRSFVPPSDSPGAGRADDPWRAATTGQPPTVAKKTVAKKTMAKKTVAKKTVAKKTIARKTVAGSTVDDVIAPERPVKKMAKKAAKKAAPEQSER